MKNGANVAAVNSEGEIPLDLADEEDIQMKEYLNREVINQGWLFCYYEYIGIFLVRYRGVESRYLISLVYFVNILIDLWLIKFLSYNICFLYSK